jgi:hypothetical protein
MQCTQGRLYFETSVLTMQKSKQRSVLLRKCHPFARLYVNHARSLGIFSCACKSLLRGLLYSILEVSKRFSTYEVLHHKLVNILPARTPPYTHVSRCIWFVGHINVHRVYICWEGSPQIFFGGMNLQIPLKIPFYWMLNTQFSQKKLEDAEIFQGGGG